MKRRVSRLHRRLAHLRPEASLRVKEEGVATDYKAGQFCLLQPGTLHSLEGLRNSTTSSDLLQQRLGHERELLRQTNYPQHDVAQYCGFADQHHFAKTFRKKQANAPVLPKDAAAGADCSVDN